MFERFVLGLLKGIKDKAGSPSEKWHVFKESFQMRAIERFNQLKFIAKVFQNALQYNLQELCRVDGDRRRALVISYS